MQVINKKIIVIFTCLGIFIFGVCKLFNKEKVVLDDVILDIRDTNNTFAIYVEESKDKYEEKNLIPTDGYIFNKEKSQCMSIDGNIIENILNYDYENNKVIVDTTESISCYLYFDKTLGLEIMDKHPKGLNLETTSSSADWTGMYRFQGQQEAGIENYICFGTEENCNANDETRNKYMYRIIGIEENGRIKVIKKEALEETEQWWTDKNTNVNWPNSKIFTNINGDEFLNNIDLVPKNWKEKIDDNNWLFGSMNNANSTYGAKQSGVEVYKIESGQKEALWDDIAESKDEVYKGNKAQSYTTTGGNNPGTLCYYMRHIEKWNETLFLHEKNAKIGLMNISDYYLSVSNDANCQLDNHTYDKCPTGWIHLLQNDNNPASQNEWTMTRYGLSIASANYSTIFIGDKGYLNVWDMSGQLSIRPVFYLKSNNMLKEGSGTEAEPFILK